MAANHKGSNPTYNRVRTGFAGFIPFYRATLPGVPHQENASQRCWNDEHFRRRATAIWNARSDSSVRQFTQEDILISGLSSLAFETTLGGPCSTACPSGCAGEQLVLAAESMEDAVLTSERRRAAASPALSGTVRVSTGGCAAGFWLAAFKRSTKTALPSGITLELIESRPRANLARREAEMVFLHVQGRHLRLSGLPAIAARTPVGVHLYRRGSTLRARAAGSGGSWERRIASAVT